MGAVPAPLPVRLRTPIVHATHVWRIGRAILAGHGVVAHTRGTWPHILRLFAWLARRRGGLLHLILIDVAPRRPAPPSSAAAASSRPPRSTGTAAAGAPHRPGLRRRPLPPAASVTVLDRTAADKLQAIRFT